MDWFSKVIIFVDALKGVFQQLWIILIISFKLNSSDVLYLSTSKKSYMKLIITVFSLFILSTLSFAQVTVTNSFIHGGVTRSYIVYVPASYTPGIDVPVLFNFHGYSSNASQQLFYGDFRSIADTAGFLIVLPEGTNDGTGTSHFNVGWGGSSVNDVAFTSALIDTLINDYSVDVSRIYSTGMSNGGFMSYHLACNLSSRIAAVGSVTGSMVAATEANCNASHPTPIIEIHGTMDPTVPYNGQSGLSVSIPAVLTHWATYNNCDASAIVTPIPNTNTTDGSTVEKSAYLNGDNCSEVVHFKVIGGGHTWPGSAINIGNTNYDINASVEIWKFLSQYDINGKINCQPVGIQEEVLSISIYPNPVQDKLYVDGAEVGSHFMIHSIDGRMVKSGIVENSIIETNDLQSNIYFVTIEGNTLKFIKSN